MPGKITGPMYYCTSCPKEYKTTNGLKKHIMTEHTVLGASNQDKVVVIQSDMEEESVDDDALKLAEGARQEMENILTTVVESVTTEMGDIFSQEDTSVTEKEIDSVVPGEGQIDTISQNMRDMVEIIEHPSQMFGSCEKCEYVSLDDKDLKAHMEERHPLKAPQVNQNTVKKIGNMLKKASVEKRSLKKEITELKKKLETERKENAVKTKRISILMVENSTKDDLSKHINTETIEKEQGNEVDTPKVPAKENGYDCSLCNFKAKSKKELEGHVKFEHLKCKTCKENFFTIEEFKSHMTKAHTNSIWHKKNNCELCKKSFSNWTLYEAHIKKHQCLRFTCTNCKEEFVTKATALEHHNNCIKKMVFSCHICDFKSQTEVQVSKHLDEVHLQGFETITNLENSIKETVQIINCIMCDFNAKTEEEVARHIDIVHLENNNTVQPEKTKTSNKACKNGDTCQFLKQNRCLFFHEVAAQPEGQWEEVRSRKQKKVRQSGEESWAKGRHGGMYRVHPITVKFCNDGDKCHRGYMRSNGKMWSCAFQHESLGFNQRFSMRKN